MIQGTQLQPDPASGIFFSAPKYSSVQRIVLCAVLIAALGLSVAVVLLITSRANGETKDADTVACVAEGATSIIEDTDATTVQLKQRRLFRRCMGDRGYSFNVHGEGSACAVGESNGIPPKQCYDHRRS
jgi:hypothetical protein